MSDLTVPLEHRPVLQSAAARLAQDFEGVFGAETIERFLVSSYDQFAGRATVANFLPLMAERYARQRLQALERVEARTGGGLPVVLFLCVHNAGRSQMALGWFHHLAGERAVAWSGGAWLDCSRASASGRGPEPVLACEPCPSWPRSARQNAPSRG